MEANPDCHRCSAHKIHAYFKTSHEHCSLLGTSWEDAFPPPDSVISFSLPPVASSYAIASAPSTYSLKQYGRKEVDTIQNFLFVCLSVSIELRLFNYSDIY